MQKWSEAATVVLLHFLLQQAIFACKKLKASRGNFSGWLLYGESFGLF